MNYNINYLKSQNMFKLELHLERTYRDLGTTEVTKICSVNLIQNLMGFSLAMR